MQTQTNKTYDTTGTSRATDGQASTRRGSNGYASNGHASTDYASDGRTQDLGSERSTGSLLHELVHEAPNLVTKELALARAEIREAMEQTRHGAMAVSAGGVVLVGGYVVLLMAAVYGLSLVLAPWAAALIVGGIATIAGYAMVQGGKRQFEASELKPERTIRAVHDDADTIRRARNDYH